MKNSKWFGDRITKKHQEVFDMGEKKNRHIQSGDAKTISYSHQRIAGKRSMGS